MFLNASETRWHLIMLVANKAGVYSNLRNYLKKPNISAPKKGIE